jgi:predicted membrane-bound spermidine synthase
MTVYLMVATGGVAALSWEVVWQLQASLAFGVSALGTAITLAATMAGMTVGSLVAGHYLRGKSLIRPLRLYGTLELCIGAAGLLMLPGFGVLESLDMHLYRALPAAAPIFHGLGIAVLIAPATLAMGATVPVFQLVARSHGASVSLLYGANIAGAASGVLLLTFWLLPALGVVYSCLLVAALNILVFVVAFARPPIELQEAFAERTGLRPSSQSRLSPRLVRIIVFGTGFTTFGLEVVWFRAMRAAFWSTSGTFAVILASVLIPLAVGARLVPWMRRRGIGPGATLAAAAAAIFLATPLVERLDLLAVVPGEYAQAMATWLLISLAIIGPAMLMLATPLPWFLEEYSDTGMTGQLYAINTLGSVAGSLLGAWALLPTVGFARSAWILGLGVLGLAIATTSPRGRRVATAIGAASLAVAVISSSSPGRDRVQGRSGFAGVEVLAFDEGPDFTATVVQLPDGRRSLQIDGFRASGGADHMFWMGSLPALLHPEPRRGLVICFGTGRTANAMRREGIPEIDVVEVSESVLEMAPLFPINEDVLKDSHVRAIVMDGRAWLRRTQQRYDLITLEPMPPNFAGMNSLYSREFYAIMTERLTSKGVAAQWVPFHLLTPHHAASVAATFLSVFPDAVLWMDPGALTGILLGRAQTTSAPLAREWPGLHRPTMPRPLSDNEIRSGVYLERDELARYAQSGTVITDDNQLLAFSQLRAGLQGLRSKRLAPIHRAILFELTGRKPVSVDR